MVRRKSAKRGTPRRKTKCRIHDVTVKVGKYSMKGKMNCTGHVHLTRPGRATFTKAKKACRKKSRNCPLRHRRKRSMLGGSIY